MAKRKAAPTASPAVAPTAAPEDSVYIGKSVKPEYLTRFYAELASAQPGMRFSVFKADGRLIARWPDELKPNDR